MVSNIGDQFGKDFPDKYPWFPDGTGANPFQLPAEVTKAEFDALKHEVQELKKLLQAAKAFDEATGQKDCEMDAKVKLIKEIAKVVGVDLGDVFDKPKK